MNSIHDIYQMLHWSNPIEIQLKGFCLAKEYDDLSLFIQPPAEPSVWECCAKIIYEKTDLELEPYLMKLLEWIQDLNWPGAVTVLNRLQLFSGEKLKQPFISSVECAIKLNTLDGKMWLRYLSELLDNTELKKTLPQSIIEVCTTCIEDGSLC